MMKYLFEIRHIRHVVFRATKRLGESDHSEAIGILGHHLRQGKNRMPPWEIFKRTTAYPAKSCCAPADLLVGA